MVTTRRDQGNGRSAARAVYFLLLTATIVAAYLVKSCDCLPMSEEIENQPGKPMLLKVFHVLDWSLFYQTYNGPVLFKR